MSLNEISGFNDLVSYYNQNRDKPWQEWLDFMHMFPRPGKQGLIGIFKSKADPSLKFAFKISQYINYLAIHEYSVMNSLVPLCDYCPHFLRGVGLINGLVEPSFKKEGNPFEITGKHPVDKEILLMEFIDRSSKFYNYINDDKWNEQIYYSIIKQTLLGVFLAQKYKFTHYDLHSNNIMIKKCDRDIVFLYVRNGKPYSVPTYGYYPIVIDYGFSYSQGIKQLWPSMGHTDIGFTSDRYDPIADAKLFLVSVSSEIDEIHSTKNSKTLINITKNLFHHLPIQWDCGWDKETHRSVADKVISKLKPYTVSKLFKDYDCYCIDLIQSLISLPTKPKSTGDLYLSYTIFQKEFLKVEQQISSPFYVLYILKGIVDLARTIHRDYTRAETRDSAMEYFRTNFYTLLKTIGDFCNPKDIHFERLVCSLYCLANGIETLLFEASANLQKEKDRNYQKLPIVDLGDIYGVIEVNIPHTYKFSDKTTVFVMDQDTGTQFTFSVKDEEAIALNKMDTYDQPQCLYQIYTQTNKTLIE